MYTYYLHLYNFLSDKAERENEGLSVHCIFLGDVRVCIEIDHGQVRWVVFSVEAIHGSGDKIREELPMFVDSWVMM
jgi:hypothetical protein